MLLDQLQSLLNGVYALEIPYNVQEFLITDAKLAEELDAGGRPVEEKLLIAEEEDSASVSLYLEENLLERLTRNDPIRRLNEENLEDFWKALEGVSHFTYYAWNALAEKSVTLLEMELQAEVDKFISTIVLLHQQDGNATPNLHRWLFSLVKFDERLSEDELTRYQDANYYAAKYCLKLAPQLAQWTACADINKELCEFYSYSQPDKIHHIEAA